MNFKRMDGDRNEKSEGLPSTKPRLSMQAAHAKSAAAAKGHTVSAKSFEPDCDDLLMLYKRIQWLKDRQKHIRVCINSDKLKNETMGIETDKLIDSIEELQNIHCAKVTAASLEELSISRLQLANMLHVLVHSDGDSLSDEMAAVREQILEMMQQYTELSLKVTEQVEDVRNLQEEILKMELELSELSTERSREIRRIAERKEREKQARENMTRNKKIDKLELKFEHNTKVLVTLNQIIQSLIGGCTMNWDKQPDIRELLFMVSKPIDVQLKESMEVHDAA